MMLLCIILSSKHSTMVDQGSVSNTKYIENNRLGFKCLPDFKLSSLLCQSINNASKSFITLCP